MQRNWTMGLMAVLLMLLATAAFAQQVGGCVPVDTQGMTDEQRAAQGYHYDPETGQWYAPDDGASTMNEETGRYEDTSFPGWTYDQETMRWYDTNRPGWSYDPVGDRWYSEDRPGEVYDLRTGRWYDEDFDRSRREREYEYDEGTGRWYDTGARYQRYEELGASSYFDRQTGRWRNQPSEYREMTGGAANQQDPDGAQQGANGVQQGAAAGQN